MATTLTALQQHSAVNGAMQMQHTQAEDTSSLPPAAATLVFPHRKQAATWDCGVACAYSLLSGFGATCSSSAAASSSSSAASTSTTLLYMDLLRALAPCETRVWTIDLTRLLHSAGVSGVRMSSKRIGVDPAHAQHAFYDHFDQDTVRVESAFKEAARSGIQLQQQHMQVDEWVHLSHTGHVMLVLVDQRFMHCSECTTKSERTLRESAPEFAGHFILILSVTREVAAAAAAMATAAATGASSSNKLSGATVTYLDPDARHGPCRMSVGDLERARTSEGTDEDCIIVNIQHNIGRRIMLDPTPATSVSSDAKQADGPKAASDGTRREEAEAGATTYGQAGTATRPVRTAPGSSASSFMPGVGTARRSARVAAATAS